MVGPSRLLVAAVAKIGHLSGGRGAERLLLLRLAGSHRRRASIVRRVAVDVGLARAVVDVVLVAGYRGLCDICRQPVMLVSTGHGRGVSLAQWVISRIGTQLAATVGHRKIASVVSSAASSNMGGCTGSAQQGASSDVVGSFMYLALAL